MTVDELKDIFYKTMDEMENPDGFFLNADIENPNFKPELKYPRVEFIEDIRRTLLRYDISQKMNFTGMFGFVLEEDEERTALRGYPSVTNLMEENSFPFARIYHYVSLFTKENEVYIKSYPELSSYLNNIIRVFPEFLTTIGKVQHHTHCFSVDVHTLKVLQGVMKHEKYLQLSVEDKRALQTAVLMHDITKKEGQIDKSHPACSAKDTSFILNRFNLSESQKTKICLLIKHHDWLERYNKNITSSVEFAKELRDGSNFLMLCILAEADLKAVQRDGVFYYKYCDVLDRGVQEISALIEINNKLNVA